MVGMAGLQVFVVRFFFMGARKGECSLFLGSWRCGMNGEWSKGSEGGTGGRWCMERDNHGSLTVIQDMYKQPTDLWRYAVCSENAPYKHTVQYNPNPRLTNLPCSLKAEACTNVIRRVLPSSVPSRYQFGNPT